jgi:hypothetical protein
MPTSDKEMNAMKFMGMVKSAESYRNGPPPAAMMEAMGKFVEEAMRAGVVRETAGLLPSSSGTRFRISGGKLTITDGPFSEAKEVVGGYAIYEVKSKEEAIDWSTRFMELHRKYWPEWEGESELRQIMEFDPQG